jgi:hypothetical protein
VVLLQDLRPVLVWIPIDNPKQPIHFTQFVAILVTSIRQMPQVSSNDIMTHLKRVAAQLENMRMPSSSTPAATPSNKPQVQPSNNNNNTTTGASIVVEEDDGDNTTTTAAAADKNTTATATTKRDDSKALVQIESADDESSDFSTSDAETSDASPSDSDSDDDADDGVSDLLSEADAQQAAALPPNEMGFFSWCKWKFSLTKRVKKAKKVTAASSKWLKHKTKLWSWRLFTAGCVTLLPATIGALRHQMMIIQREDMMHMMNMSKQQGAAGGGGPPGIGGMPGMPGVNLSGMGGGLGGLGDGISMPSAATSRNPYQYTH